jgi:hypothetical protein
LSPFAHKTRCTAQHSQEREAACRATIHLCAVHVGVGVSDERGCVVYAYAVCVYSGAAIAHLRLMLQGSLSTLLPSQPCPADLYPHRLEAIKHTDMKAKVANFRLVSLTPDDGKCISVDRRHKTCWQYWVPCARVCR